MRYRLGRHDGSLADLAQARELAVQGGDAIAQADVMLDEAMALDWLFEWRRSRELAERARDLVSSVLDRPVGRCWRPGCCSRSADRFTASTRTTRPPCYCARQRASPSPRATRATRCW